METSLPNLQIIPSGPIPPDPVRLLRSIHKTELFQSLTERADYVIVGSPSLLTVTDTIILSSSVGSVLLFANVKVTLRKDAKAVVRISLREGSNVVGSVLNGQTKQEDGSSYYYSPALDEGWSPKHPY